jgi:hypothetical protein
VHPRWHRRHRPAAGELQTKPLESALDPLKLAPDRDRLATLRQEPDQVARLAFQAKDLGLQVVDPATPLPERAASSNTATTVQPRRSAYARHRRCWSSIEVGDWRSLEYRA